MFVSHEVHSIVYYYTRNCSHTMLVKNALAVDKPGPMLYCKEYERAAFLQCR